MISRYYMARVKLVPFLCVLKSETIPASFDHAAEFARLSKQSLELSCRLGAFDEDLEAGFERGLVGLR
jgi:hypothetical protein